MITTCQRWPCSHFHRRENITSNTNNFTKNLVDWKKFVIIKLLDYESYHHKSNDNTAELLLLFKQTKSNLATKYESFLLEICLCVLQSFVTIIIILAQLDRKFINLPYAHIPCFCTHFVLTKLIEISFHFFNQMKNYLFSITPLMGKINLGKCLSTLSFSCVSLLKNMFLCSFLLQLERYLKQHDFS